MKPDYVCNDCGQEISPNEYDKLSETFCPECGGQIRENTEKNWCYSVATGDIIGPVYDSDIIKAYQEKIIDLETQIYHLGKYEWKPLSDWDLLSTALKVSPPESKKINNLTNKKDINPLLIFCGSCNHQFSKRATKCPKCGWSNQALCLICNKKIPLKSTTCPECGDPDPFNELGDKNSSKITQVSSFEPMITENSKYHNELLSSPRKTTSFFKNVLYMFAVIMVAIIISNIVVFCTKAVRL